MAGGEARARAVIQTRLSSAGFKRFSSGREGGGGSRRPCGLPQRDAPSRAREVQAAWPVAIVTAPGATQLGLSHHARVVVLTSTDVAKSVHAERWAKFGPAQWSKVQAALDTGEHFRRPRDGAHFFALPAERMGSRNRLKRWTIIIRASSSALHLENFLAGGVKWLNNQR